MGFNSGFKGLMSQQVVGIVTAVFLKVKSDDSNWGHKGTNMQHGCFISLLFPFRKENRLTTALKVLPMDPLLCTLIHGAFYGCQLKNFVIICGE